MARKERDQASRRGEAATSPRRGPRADARGAPSDSAPPRAGRAGRSARDPSCAADDTRAIYLRLTPQQVGELACKAHDDETIGMLEVLAGRFAREKIPPFPYWEKRYRQNARGSEFLLSTLKGLLVFAHLLGGEPVGVTDLAARLQLKPSAIHRYLGTLLILGLAQQHPKTRKYRLAR